MKNLLRSILHVIFFLSELSLSNDIRPYTSLEKIRRDFSNGISLVSSLSIIAPGASLALSSAGNGLKDEWYNPNNERIFDTKRNSYLPTATAEHLIMQELNQKNQRVVVVGEIHSNPCHHRVEFDIVKSFLNANSVNKVPQDYAIGLECFYRQHQPALDRYIFSHSSIKTLKEETSWDESWGYDLNYYAKIFNFASKNKIRLLGLNIPYPVAKYVGSVGIDNIPAELRSTLPHVDITNKRHRYLISSSSVTF